LTSTKLATTLRSLEEQRKTVYGRLVPGQTRNLQWCSLAHGATLGLDKLPVRKTEKRAKRAGGGSDDEPPAKLAKAEDGSGGDAVSPLPAPAPPRKTGVAPRKPQVFNLSAEQRALALGVVAGLRDVARPRDGECL